MSLQNWQNVGKPRFYVDLFQYLNAIGQIKHTSFRAHYMDSPYPDVSLPLEFAGTSWPGIYGDRVDQFAHPFGLDPWKFRTAPFQHDGAVQTQYCFNFDNEPIDASDTFIGSDIQDKTIHPASVSKHIDYVGIFGHGLAGQPSAFGGEKFEIQCAFNQWYDADGSGSYNKGVMNGLAEGYENIHGTYLNNSDASTLARISLTHLNGWSLWKVPQWEAPYNNWAGNISYPHAFHMILRAPKDADGNYLGSYRPSDYAICSLSAGRIYDMPVSPNMKLRFSRDFDGIDTQKTRGGSTLTNIRYTGQPNWGNGAAAWSKFGDIPGHNITRAGRRSWSLSFDEIADDDLMGAYESITNFPYAHNSWGGAEADDPYDTNPNGGQTAVRHLPNPLMEENNFYSQVLLKTLGGSLPFIFQPDSSNNSPDQFAICRIKRNSFRFSQKSHNRYNFKLDIEETW